TPAHYNLVESWIYRDARPMCSLLWHGLATSRDREMEYQKETWKLSLQQNALMQVAQNKDSSDLMTLTELEQRGLIERTNGKWQVFADVMRQFVLRQGNIDEPPPLSSLEVPNHTAVIETARTEAPIEQVNGKEPTNIHQQTGA